MDLKSGIFVSLVSAGLAAWCVAYVAQHRLPLRMQGISPAAFRAIGHASRDVMSPSRALVRCYLGACCAFAFCMVAALVAWFALGLAA